MCGATSSKIRSASGSAPSEDDAPTTDASRSMPVSMLQPRFSTSPSVYATSVPPAGSSTIGFADLGRIDVAERRRERVPEALDDGAVAVHEQRRRVSRGRVGELLRVGIERQAQRRRHLVLVDVPEHAPQHVGGRRVLVGVRAEGVPQLAHQHGGGHAVAGDVADGHVHDAVGAPDRVVPVAADQQAGAARVVAADQLDALDVGKVVGEQAALQPHGDLVLALERGRAVERLRGLLGVPGDLRLLALVQRMRVREQQAERAEAVAAAVHERRRVERVRFSEQRLVHARERRPQIGVLADHDRRAGVECERRRLRDHEVERVGARGNAPSDGAESSSP